MGELTWHPKCGVKTIDERAGARDSKRKEHSDEVEGGQKRKQRREGRRETR